MTIATLEESGKMVDTQPNNRAPANRSARSREHGSSLVEATVVLFFILLPLLVGVIDFGRAYFFSIEVANAAKAGAQYGAQSTGGTMTDASGITAAAKSEAPDIASTCSGTGACWASGYPVATWGCECASTSTPGGGTNSCGITLLSCAPGHLVNFVVVTAQATYTPFFNFRGLFPPMTLSSTTKVRLAAQ